MLHNIVALHTFWVSVIRGIIRGSKGHSAKLKAAFKGEPTTEPRRAYTEEAVPPNNNPDIVSLTKARDIVLDKIMSGKRYTSVDDILEDLNTEYRFQKLSKTIN